MKILTLLLLLTISSITYSQPINRSFESANGRLMLLGKVSLERLAEEPFGEWYTKNLSEYEVNEEVQLDMSLADSITIFMGTWCGDSRREVPRFVKILESENYDMSKLKIVCLNTGFQNYKQAPEREERGLDIHRVPTFIFHNGEGEEIGRIVEEPVESLEQDLKTVLSGEEYNTAYPIANKVIEYLNTYSIKELKKKKSQLIAELKHEENMYELNTYGFVLWSSFQLSKAQFVFELNSELFPKKTRTHLSLARFMNSLGKHKEALARVKKGLQIEPENENLIELRSKINEEVN